MFLHRSDNEVGDGAAWRRFGTTFLRVLFGGATIIYLLILLVDPYDVVAFSLPMERRIVSISQRHMYPQIVRSGRYDSLVIGSSTSRLLDPELLDKEFNVRFANLAMDAMLAWEQRTMMDLFLRTVGPPKALIIGIDGVWCDPSADRNRSRFDFPEWMYDGNRWNDYLYLLNSATAEITGRLIGYKLGLYRERIRRDGYQVFTPPEDQYDLAKARQNIWHGRTPLVLRDLPPPVLTDEQRQALSFPALQWMDAILRRMPASTMKVLAFMPVHVAAQPAPGSIGAAVEAECKSRIAEIGRWNGARVVDWRIPSPITREDRNYWDNLHYRLPIATRLAEEIGDAVLQGEPSRDGSYRILVP